MRYSPPLGHQNMIQLTSSI